jgi:hypothetical protein
MSAWTEGTHSLSELLAPSYRAKPVRKPQKPLARVRVVKSVNEQGSVGWTWRCLTCGMNREGLDWSMEKRWMDEPADRHRRNCIER